MLHKDLQSHLIKSGIDALFIPSTDPYRSEYVHPFYQRLRFATGFSGSMGAALITPQQSYIFVDGRYTLQASQQVNTQHFCIKDYTKCCIKEALACLSPQACVCIDPWLISHKEAAWFMDVCHDLSLSIQWAEQNPLDMLWKTREAPPCHPISFCDVKYMGLSSQEKYHKLQAYLKQNDLDCYVLTQLDSIAWLCNARGQDIPHNPLFFSRAIVHKSNGIDIYCAASPMPKSEGPLRFHPLKDFCLPKSEAIVGFDDTVTPYALTFPKSAVSTPDPVTAIKAAKHPAELKATRACHIRDGAYITKLLYWIHTQGIGKTEKEVATHCYNLRKQDPLFKDLSFATISASGPSAALPHYGGQDNRTLTKDSVFLIDSGGQYLDGTTDITRTLFLGETPPHSIAKAYTLVLKGHIALASLRFPHNTPGIALDAIARQFLWRYNMDYNHGTGHGVGVYLNVHEGPQRIAKHGSYAALIPGMILSNEPGYYEDNSYGIRIENLIVVQECTPSMLMFDTISWAPLERSLIVPSLLSIEERTWINTYHETVIDKVSDKLSSAEKEWLYQIAQPL